MNKTSLYNPKKMMQQIPFNTNMDFPDLPLLKEPFFEKWFVSQSGRKLRTFTGGSTLCLRDVKVGMRRVGGDVTPTNDVKIPHPLPRPWIGWDIFARPNARELALNDVKLEDARDRATKSLETFLEANGCFRK